MMQLPYSLTPWSRVLVEKLTSFHLVKKFSFGNIIRIIFRRLQQNTNRLYIREPYDVFFPLTVTLYNNS
jgi:hypothetical protein